MSHFTLNDWISNVASVLVNRSFVNMWYRLQQYSQATPNLLNAHLSSFTASDLQDCRRGFDPWPQVLPLDMGENSRHNTSESWASIFTSSSRNSKPKILNTQKQKRGKRLNSSCMWTQRKVQKVQTCMSTSLTAGFHSGLLLPGVVHQDWYPALWSQPSHQPLRPPPSPPLPAGAPCSPPHTKSSAGPEKKKKKTGRGLWQQTWTPTPAAIRRHTWMIRPDMLSR